jgi:hypothetical protein
MEALIAQCNQFLITQMNERASVDRRPLLIAVSIVNAFVGVGLAREAGAGSGCSSAPGSTVRHADLHHDDRGAVVAINLSSGQREDVASRLIFVPTVISASALAWLMPTWIGATCGHSMATSST